MNIKIPIKVDGCDELYFIRYRVKYRLSSCIELYDFIGFIYPNSNELSTDFIKTEIVDNKIKRILPIKAVFSI